MGTKRNKPTDVNKVRRLSASQDINLGMSKAKDLEDEIKRPRRKATTLDTKKHTRVPSEDDYVRKGRRLKAEKQKEYKDIVAAIDSVDILYEHLGDVIKEQVASGTLELTMQPPQGMPLWLSILPTVVIIIIFINIYLIYTLIFFY